MVMKRLENRHPVFCCGTSRYHNKRQGGCFQGVSWPCVTVPAQRGRHQKTDTKRIHWKKRVHCYGFRAAKDGLFGGHLKSLSRDIYTFSTRRVTFFFDVFHVARILRQYRRMTNNGPGTLCLIWRAFRVVRGCKTLKAFKYAHII